jgi:hypothetical protein
MWNALSVMYRVQVENLKKQTLKPGFHFIGSMVENRRSFKLWVKWIKLAQPHREHPLGPAAAFDAHRRRRRHHGSGGAHVSLSWLLQAPAALDDDGCSRGGGSGGGEGGGGGGG